MPGCNSEWRSGRALVAGTFAKSLFPGVRLGFLIVPDALVSTVIPLATLIPGPPPVLQRALAALLDGGQYGRHVARARSLYARRRSAVTTALEAELGDRVRIDAGSGGLHLLLTWRGGASGAAVVAAAHARGLRPPRSSRPRSTRR